MEYINLFEEVNLKRKFTGEILSGDTIIGKVVDNTIVDLDAKFAPIYLIRTKDFEGWLQNRSIDLHRKNSRLLRKMLRLRTTDEAQIVLSVNAVTITDNYWVRPNRSFLTYEQVKFNDDSLSSMALYGDMNIDLSKAIKTPELTNMGSYEKCWRLHNGEWWLYKQGTYLERFSELFTYKLGKALNMCMAHYETSGNYIRSKDFTQGATNFEPMHSFVGDEEDYNTNLDILYKINPRLLKCYLDILVLDTIVLNVDRHTFNYGVLRSKNTGEIIKLAPNFDNNLSLISRGYPNLSNVRIFIDDFRSINSIYLRDYKFPYLDRKMLNNVIDECANEFMDLIDREFVASFCMNNYERLINI